MRTNTVVVVAYKLNDVYYANSTSEVRNSDKSILIDFCGFPLEVVSGFYAVKKIRYRRGVFGILLNLVSLAILRVKFGCAQSVISSNYQLFYTRIISSFIYRGAGLILVEDGVMNYRSERIFMPGSALERLPSMLLDALKISENAILKRVRMGYFLRPDLISLKVNKKKLSPPISIPHNHACDLLEKVDGKSVFIGQPLYVTGGVDEGGYFHVLDELYGRGLFDYYIPHLKEPEIRSGVKFPVLDISHYNATLEMIAPGLTKMTVLTFSSSIAYTLPVINSKIRSNIIVSNVYANHDIRDLFARLIPAEAFSALEINA